VLAGIERLDTPLNIAQMQGKFQLALIPAGHCIQVSGLLHVPVDFSMDRWIYACTSGFFDGPVDFSIDRWMYACTIGFLDGLLDFSMDLL
jgi:hypothetical protein